MYQEEIINHYKSCWKNEPKIYLWDKGPIEKLPFEFRVLEFPPNRERDMWTYSTCGLSQATDNDPIELHIFSSTQDNQLIELLTTIAYYHRNRCFLGLNHIVNFGKPWQNESISNFGFISLPFLDGPDLENLYFQENGRPIKFYWLIPITEKEKKYLSKFGVDALEEKFDNGFNYIDPHRQSVV